MRRAQTTSAAKPPRIGRGFYIPVILATAGIHPFAIFPFARSANGNLLPKMANPLRRQSRRKFPPPKAALIYAAFCGATHSRIFPSCFARWFALRANSKNAAIIAYAIMTAPKARLDSRLRGNDNWGRWFSANAIFGTCGNDKNRNHGNSRIFRTWRQSGINGFLHGAGRDIRRISCCNNKAEVFINFATRHY